MTEQVQDNIYLVDAKSRLPCFQFADKPNADPARSARSMLSQLVLFSLLSDEYGSCHIIPFQCDFLITFLIYSLSVVMSNENQKKVPIGDKNDQGLVLSGEKGLSGQHGRKR